MLWIAAGAAGWGLALAGALAVVVATRRGRGDDGEKQLPVAAVPPIAAGRSARRTPADLVAEVARDLGLEDVRLFHLGRDGRTMTAVAATTAGGAERLARELAQQAVAVRSILVVYPHAADGGADRTRPTVAAAAAVVRDGEIVGALTGLSHDPGRIFSFGDRRSLLRGATAAAEALLRGAPRPTPRRSGAGPR